MKESPAEEERRTAADDRGPTLTITLPPASLKAMRAMNWENGFAIVMPMHDISIEDCNNFYQDSRRITKQCTCGEGTG